MSRSAINEAEHRRGMVLGFTLAEVLLLLLFLLLLALGAQLAKLQAQLEATPDQDKAERLRLELQLKQVAPILQAAEKIDPSDPPEALRRGLDFVRKFGSHVQPDQLSTANAQVAAIVDDAAKLDPSSRPEHLIKRSLEILRKVGPETPTNQVQRVSPEMAKIIEKAKQIAPQDPTGALQEGLEKVTATYAVEKGKHDWPPIISLSEADGYFFASGSADLSPQFQMALSQVVVRRLMDIVQQYDVNVIEVVGHTDEQPLSGKPSNLDKLLFPFLRGQSSEKFIPSDNAGLGLARAVAVLRFLREDQRLKDFRVIPLSGAQLTTVGDRLAPGGHAAVKARRRIEIRVRRSDREESAEVVDPPLSGPADPLLERPEKIIPSITPFVTPAAPPALGAPVESATKPHKPSCSAIDQWPNPCP
jgi:flagellar motor protein MotB